jgi:peptidoglycan hydrolase-like protein with peptidoglycan-binding domain
MSWRLAKSLGVLRDEINQIAPSRSKEYDGDIGDEAHQGRDSDHNPNYYGVVCGADFTHDPANGADMDRLAQAVAKSGYPDLKYVIRNYRIWNKFRGWHDYTGSNPHTTHMHVSVGVGPDGQSKPPYDDTVPWGIAKVLPPPDPAKIVYRLTKPFMRGAMVEKIQQALGIDVDGIYGPATMHAVMRFQETHPGLSIDGKVGPQTLKAFKLA